MRRAPQNQDLPGSKRGLTLVDLFAKYLSVARSIVRHLNPNGVHSARTAEQLLAQHIHSTRQKHDEVEARLETILQ